jgi:hypothetical protein
MLGAQRSSANVGTQLGGFRVLNAEGNLSVTAWGYWPGEVSRAFAVKVPAAAQMLAPSSIFVLDSRELKPQGVEGQEALRLLFRVLAQLPFAKGTILRGNAMTGMQLSRLLRECGADGCIEFADTQSLGT